VSTGTFTDICQTFAIVILALFVFGKPGSRR
jgi:hypothetical protein